MGIKDKVSATVVREGIKMLQKDFDTNSIKLVEMAEKIFVGNELYLKTLAGAKKTLQRKDYVWRNYLRHHRTKTAKFFYELSWLFHSHCGIMET